MQFKNNNKYISHLFLNRYILLLLLCVLITGLPFVFTFSACKKKDTLESMEQSQIVEMSTEEHSTASSGTKEASSSASSDESSLDIPLPQSSE